MCYRSSVKSNNYNAKESLITEEAYKRSVREIEGAVLINQEKRAHYEQKYPDLAQHRQNQLK
jgi:hypothetical protein